MAGKPQLTAISRPPGSRLTSCPQAGGLTVSGHELGPEAPTPNHRRDSHPQSGAGGWSNAGMTLPIQRAAGLHRPFLLSPMLQFAVRMRVDEPFHNQNLTPSQVFVGKAMPFLGSSTRLPRKKLLRLSYMGLYFPYKPRFSSYGRTRRLLKSAGRWSRGETLAS